MSDKVIVFVVVGNSNNKSTNATLEGVQVMMESKISRVPCSDVTNLYNISLTFKYLHD